MILRTVVPADKRSKGFYIDQVSSLPNACGTIALLHAITNNEARLGVSADSPVGRFKANGEQLTPTERGQLLDTFAEIKSSHNDMVLQGDTAPIESDNVVHHYVCLTEIDGNVVEFDGSRKDAPYNHGSIPAGSSFLAAAAEVVKTQFFARSDATDFALLAASVSQD